MGAPGRPPPLPHAAERLYLTDGGMETTLVFHHGLELPSFASFVLLDDEEGTAALRAYFEPYVDIAAAHGTGLALDAPTWRANRDWGAQLGYDEDALADVNRRAVALVEEVRRSAAGRGVPVAVSGCIGPRGDAYDPADLMSPAEAERYHAAQVETLSGTSADLVSALTMTHVEEAIGIVRAAAAADVPVAISFTVETDGRLPSGQELSEAVEQVDAETDGAAAYFMVNCAHPTHFAHVLERGAWRSRVRGLRANASALSHAELDEAEELDDGDPLELADRYVALRERLPLLNVLGGCCGTDHRHVDAIAAAWLRAG